MNPEQRPASQQNHEISAPSFDIGEHASGVETGNEKERQHEQGEKAHQADRQPAAPLPVVPMPLPTVSVPVPTTQQSDDSAGPTIAADDDLIEKEWVDKAKNIIAQTQNDPYKREREVGKLQADYLRKRYGKELGTSN